MAFDGPGRSSGSSMSQINVTPLVDVMLVLLVIFMVTAPIIQQGVSVDLPTVEAGPLAEDSIPVVISVTREGEVYLNDQVLSPDELKKELDGVATDRPDDTVLVRADEKVPYGEVLAVMAAVRSAGIRRVGMVTSIPQS
jgi:biopolymer transport protein TolR